MPNYTADPDAAAIAPDLGQLPGAEPVLDLPADGEPANAASVAQAFSALANHVARLYRPRASSSSYVLDLLPFRNAKDIVVSKVDAFGLYRGPIIEYHESWPTHIGEHAATGGQATPWGEITGGAPSVLGSERYPGWWYGIHNTPLYTASRLVETLGPYMAAGRLSASRRVQLLTPPSQVDNLTFIARRSPWAIGANVLASLEFNIAYLICPGPANMGWLIPNPAIAPFAAIDWDPESGTNGIYVQANTDDANLQLITGSSATKTDLGVARGDLATLGARLRLVFVGSELDFSSANRVLVFIDDILRADVTTDLPAAGAIPWINFGGKALTPGGLVVQLHMMLSDLHEQVFVLP